jgi:hypothetical protein
MEREQAERSLAIIRSVIENTRDDLVERNWGIIWIIHSFINFAAAASGTWIDRRGLSVFWYALPLFICSLINIFVVLMFMSREQGVRSYIERQLWATWIVFVVFTGAGIVAIYLTQTRPSFFGIIFALNCGICFSMMGIVFYKQFLLVSGLFLVVAVAAAAWTSIQWWLIGGAWWLATFIPGWCAYRERSRRLQNAKRTRIL